MSDNNYQNIIASVLADAMVDAENLLDVDLRYGHIGTVQVVVDLHRLAAALIDRLGWEREFSIGNDEDGRVLWLDGEEPVTPKDGETVEVRWISPWVPNE